MEKGRKAADICKEYPSLSKQTLSNWKKNKDKIYAIVDANASSACKNYRKRKCVCSLAYEIVEKVLYTWFVDARHKKAPISTAILQAKAVFFAKQFAASDGDAKGETKFTGSDGFFFFIQFFVQEHYLPDRGICN